MGHKPFQLYNSLTNRVEPFEPLDPPRVRMYNCGPTVYDFAHIGNFRAFLTADVLRRALELNGWEVEQVMNLTDVGHMTEDDFADGAGQDKMAAALERESKKTGGDAKRNFDNPWDLAQFYIDAFMEDYRRLNLKEPLCFPRATEHVPEMVGMVEGLLANDHAYQAPDGTIYFSVESFPAYGKLSNNTLDDLRSGAGGRVSDEHQAGKRHPADFALWKQDSRHLMTWETALGEGFPGWHVECSAMSRKYLGDTLDIHTGGEDNKFPHHECEIAQSEGLTGKPYVRCWVHTTHLLVENHKMSKSAGNFFTIRDLVDRGYHPLALRLCLIKTHYRQPYNFTLDGLAATQREVERFRECRARLEDRTGDAQARGVCERDAEVRDRFLAAMADDLNISAALAVVHDYVTETNRELDRLQPTETAQALDTLRVLDSVLGVIFADVETAEVGESAGLDDDAIEALLAERQQARKDRNFARADEIRDQLIEQGIELKDTPDGTTWKRKAELV